MSTFTEPNWELIIETADEAILHGVTGATAIRSLAKDASAIIQPGETLQNLNRLYVVSTQLREKARQDQDIKAVEYAAALNAVIMVQLRAWQRHIQLV